MIVGRGGEERESTSARVVVGTPYGVLLVVFASWRGQCACLYLRTGYRVMHISTYVVCGN